MYFETILHLFCFFVFFYPQILLESLWEKLRSRLLLQIHDELMLESPLEEIETVRRLLDEEMTSVWELSVPFKVDVEVGKGW